LIKKLIKEALAKGSNDLHVKTDAVPKIRVLRELVELGDKIVTEAEVYQMLDYMIGSEGIARLKNEMDMDFAFEEDDFRLRINAFYQQEKPCFIARIIGSHIPTFEELGLPEVVKEIALKPKGIIMVTGPASCGKTTTIASIVDFINENVNTHIITLEQPIEYKFTSKAALIDQREVGRDTESFVSGLKYALRQDPDIVMVGEMRDLETISTAITTAETGHLVLSTLHTSSAVGTISRIVNSFPPHQRDEIRTQISLSIQGIISQVLIPKADGSGLVPVYEVLFPTYGARNLIRADKLEQIKSIMQTDKKCSTLQRETLKLISQGVIKKEDAVKVVKLEE
jgi:twitching motility protein PilT